MAKSMNRCDDFLNMYSLLSTRSQAYKEEEHPGCGCLLCHLLPLLGPFKIFPSQEHVHSIYNNPALVLYHWHSTRHATSTENIISEQVTSWKCKQDQTCQSDLPKHVSLDDLPDTVCYHDIKLFYLKDSDSKCDFLCAIIEFFNLKGQPEGTDGTKFLMHGDYQLVYCPIN